MVPLAATVHRDPELECSRFDVGERKGGAPYLGAPKLFYDASERYRELRPPHGQKHPDRLRPHSPRSMDRTGPPISPNYHEAPTLTPRVDGPGWLLYHE